MRSARRALSCSAAASVAAVALVVAASSARAGPAYIWTGSGTSGSAWSAPLNWEGGVAPASDADDGTLDFPAVAAADLQGGTARSVDDLTGASADGLAIDDATPYDLYGVAGAGGPLALGSGGLLATTSSTVVDPPEIELPLVLSAPQTWSVDGGPSGVGEVLMDDAVSGSGVPLGVDLSDDGVLELLGGGASATPDGIAVGRVTITGADPAEHGVEAFGNGAVGVGVGATLDAAGGGAVALTDAALFGEGSVGAVSSSGGVLAPGDPLGTLSVDGPLTLDSSSALRFAIAGEGATAADHSQLDAGDVALGGAALALTGAGVADDCPALSGGSVETLISSSGTISGTFAGLPNGAIVALDCVGVAPEVEIDYGASAVTATVLPVPTMTTLTASPMSPAAGAPLTLTATVSGGSAPPQGTVEFDVAGVAIPGCGAVALSAVGSASIATCETTFATAGGHTVEADYAPADPRLLSASGTSQPLTVGMAAGADDQPAAPQLTVSIAGAGRVARSAGAAPIASCPGACTGSAAGAQITLVALPAAGSTFAGWGGVCAAERTRTCSVLISAGARASAVFTAARPPAAARLGAPVIGALAVDGSRVTVRLAAPVAASGLQCALVRGGADPHADAPRYAPCPTLAVFRHLRRGRYTLYARATVATRRSPPATRRFSI